ncbi:tartrate dehydrogenase [Novibacillus thermophilus]|mgnify:CR=1 FL=1|jgi:tartrate dehydrogenase/decarboxylase/D-malate dehydrogenase|uniref:D-malate dehydrogenase (decarboxylating) n=1 Tax=Novibacillus thermophilus TaxID=1471761 RepID=A0A1U9K4V2_9BACL|nr:tartrate dehydrogenase [Novibacillus thermophilus]AQS55081.1 tartrate dehydrogenase [Novibacillus thermophilus]
MKVYDIAVIPGDGIGKETVPVGQKVMETVADIHGGLKFNWHSFDWGCEYYLKKGRMMPDDGIKTLSQFHHIFLGAVGNPQVPDHISLWGLLIPIRRQFQQYINLRPVQVLRGLTSPLKQVDATIKFIIVRENTEGEYSSVGGIVNRGLESGETALQVSSFSRTGCERVIRYAFERAKQTERKRLVAATKSNGIIHTMPFWDRIFKEIAAEYPDVDAELTHVDALAAKMILKPQAYDVIVASNLFGDILSDLGGAVMGSIGIAPSANLNPEGRYPSMFEPVHGSAPDISGKSIANPLGQVWTACLLLEHIGEYSLARRVLDVVQDLLEERIVTPDLGGRYKTKDVEHALITRLKNV